MDRFYEQINELVQDLLIPARTQKRVNKEAFEQFCDILEKIEKEVKGKDSIPRKLAGLLFFIYCSLSWQVGANHYENELSRAVGTVEGFLDRIFDSPFN